VRTRYAIAGGIGALAAAVAAVMLATRTHARAELPPASAGIPVGRPPPATALTDDAGHPFAIDSLRGAPALLIFFRGAT
jgi:cytochrome oxidase Cu insertion factor (SCO1/SenC/PrrC family)